MTWWYVNRAAGLVSWVLLSASIVFGLLLSSKALGRKVRPNWIQDLHRGLSGLAVVFVGVHVAGAIGDNYLHFGWAETLVPFTSSWRPTAIAWGVVSMYLLVAVELSSLLRKHIPKTAWRKIHFLSFPLFLTATAHGVTAGTEMGSTAGIAAAALVTAAIAGLTTYRVIAELDKAKHPPAPRIPSRPAPAPMPSPMPTPAPMPAATVAPRTVTVTPATGASPHPDVAPAPAEWARPAAPRSPEPIGRGSAF